VKIILLVLALMASGCSLADLNSMKFEGAEASALCIKGGYALAGGVVAGAKVNEGFSGEITINDDCSLTINSK